jgi:hypothetical protein
MNDIQNQPEIPTRISVEPSDAGFEAYGDLLRKGDVYVRIDGTLQRGVITADSAEGFVEKYDPDLDADDIGDDEEWPTVVLRGAVTITLRENPETARSRRATVLRLKANAEGMAR